MSVKGNILVTGGCGYIGSHTTVELLQHGYQVHILDNLSESNEKVLDGIEKTCGKRPTFTKLELCNEHEVMPFFQKQKDSFDCVIHFAAHKHVGESFAKPLKYYKNNVFSLVNLLAAMKEINLLNLVFSSSCTVYGDADTMPVTEENPFKPAVSPYGNTKKISENILSDFSNVSDLQAISLRYFNPIGAHSNGHIGESPIGTPNNLLPYICQTAKGLREKLSINGNDYPTPDGTNVRDYIHVCDVADAHVLAVERLLARKNKNAIEAFNLGTGKGTSILEMVKEFEKVNKVKVAYEIVKRRNGDVAFIYADCRLAEKELGWKAKRNLEEMLHSAWEWEKKQN